MIKFLRKILLIDFVLSMVQSKQDPHTRFAGFLEVFSFLWMIWGILLLGSAFSNKTRSEGDWSMLVLWVIACAGFFFFYRYTGKILKSYSQEQASRFSYLRYINPIAPVIYFTTAFLVALGILNMVMLVFLVVGTLFFLIGILITFGALMLDDNYKLDNFIGLPNAFFKAEEYFLEHIIGPEILITFLILLYFIIPVSASSMILWQHHTKKE